MKKIILFCIMLLTVNMVFAQQKEEQEENDCVKSHQTKFDFYDSLRILPVKILSYDSYKKFIIAEYSDNREVHVIQLSLLKEGNYEINNEYDENISGTKLMFMVIYCKVHFKVFQITLVERGKKLKLKKK